MPRTILVVDDSSLERTVLTAFLKDEYKVLTAESGKEMISILRSRAKTISAILLDIIMPEMDGFDALRKIRENAIYRQIPVIVATGLMDEESQVKAMSLGANGYVVKPFNQTLLKYTVQNAIDLREKSALTNSLRRDALTGLPNRATFFQTAQTMISREEPGYYVLSCFDIENFKIINDQYGVEAGDEVLKHIAEVLDEGVNSLGGACCRYSADKFGVLYPAECRDSDELKAIHRRMANLDVIKRSFKIRVGRYLVDDLSLPINAMYDRATMAEESIRGKYDTYVAEYTDSMRQRLLNEQHIVNDMSRALAEGEFEPWLQPQYNHLTGALIGAEALARWRKDGALVSPAEFVPVFERNGFIYEMDQCIWDKVCALLRRWLDEGRKPLPLSVNISRKDLLHTHFIPTLLGIVQKYDIPYKLLRLEVTESAFSDYGGQIIQRVDELIAMGFTVEIDDFGSGYSSLNTLKDVPATVLKLDMRFFENTINQQRGGNIVESVVRMAKWLGMSVIAEGVEQKEQADYLKSIGCYYIQGFYYAKPMPVSEYESLLDSREGEPELARLQTLKTLNNNEFWNPKSMETLIFNSYVGGACIFEFHGGEVELLRANEQYAAEFGQLMSGKRKLSELGFVKFLDEENKRSMLHSIRTVIDTECESTCELRLRDDSAAAPCTEYVRFTGRVIARADDRYLCYCVIQNTTKLHMAQKEALKASERVKAIMDNSQCGITAAAMDENDKVEYLFVNNRFYEMLGYTRELFEAEAPDIFSSVHPEDRRRVMDRALQLRRVGQTYVQQFRAVRRDGRVIWLRCDTTVVRFADDPRVVQLNNMLDITEQLETERKQLESARRLEVIMSNVSGGVSALQIFDDGTSSFVFNNERYYELYGYTRAQATAAKLDVMKTIVPEDLPGVMEKVKKLKAERSPMVIDYRAIKRDGSLVYLRANSSMMYMEGYGDVVTSVVTDITEQRELSDRFEAVVKNINGGVSATHLKKGEPSLVIVNDQYFKLIGYTREQLEAGHIKIFDLVHPDDRERVKRQFAEAGTHLGRYTMEYRIIRGDGEVRNILCNTNVIRLFGVEEPVQLAVSNDITELRQAQQKERDVSKQLQTILGNIRSGVTASVFRARDDVEVIFANKGFYDMHGYTREQFEAEKPNVLDLVVPEDRERTMAIVERIAREGGSETYEYRCRRRDGSVLWVQCSNTVITVEGEKAPILLAVSTDITEEKEANEQLRFLNDSAHDILAQPDSDIAIDKTLENLLTYFNADRAYVVELDYEKHTSGNTYEKCAEGVSSEMQNLQGVPFGSGDDWYDTLQKNEFVVIRDVSALGPDRAKVRKLLLAQGIRSIIIAPLWRDGALVGFAGIDNPRRALQQHDRLKALADYIAILLTRRDLNAKIVSDQQTMTALMNDTLGGFVRMKQTPSGAFVPVYANDGFGDMLGLSHEALQRIFGRDVLAGVHPKDRAIVRRAGESMVKNGTVESVRFRVKNDAGDYVWLTLYGRMTKDASGGVYLNVYYSDATKQVSEEQKQKDLLDNLPCGAGLYEFDGTKLTVVHVNKRYQQMVGRDINNEKSPSVMDAVYPDDQSRVTELMRSSASGARDGSCDVRIRHADGTYHTYRINGRVISRKNGKWSCYVTFLPISIDQLSVQQVIPYLFPAMMESSTDITFAKDKNFRYLCCSHAYAKVLGLGNEKAVVGKTDYELFPSDIADQFRRDDLALIQSGRPIIDKMETLPSGSGLPYYTRISKYLLKDTVGDVLGIYGVGRDITQRKETSDQLELLTNSIPGGIATFSCTADENRLEYFNDGFSALFGYTRDELAAMTMEQVMGFIFKEDRPEVDARIAMLVRDGAPIDCVYRAHTKDGGYRWVNHKAVVANRVKNAAIVNALFLDVTELQEEKERLRVSEELNRLAIGHSGNIITRFDVESRTLTLPDRFNPIFELPPMLYNLPGEQIALGRVSPDTADIYTELFESVVRGEATGMATYKQNSSKGWRWLEAQFTTVFSSTGKPVSAVISFSDVTEKLEKEVVYNKWQQSLTERPEESYTLFRCNLSADTAFDSREGKLLTARLNDAKATLEQHMREYAEQYVCEQDRAKYLAFLNRDTLLAEYGCGHRSDTLEYRERTPSGAIRWLRLTIDLVEYPSSKDVEAYLLYEDIDEQKKGDLLTLKRSQTDPLTGVLNRTTFVARMDKAIAASRPDEKHALMMLDVDDFKRINDTLGHGVGDEVLKSLTARIGAILRRDDLIGRLGGDEFFVLLMGIPTREAAAAKAERICEIKTTVSGADIAVTASIGIAMIPEDGTDFETLYHKVDRALYRQKERGKHGFAFAADPSA